MMTKKELEKEAREYLAEHSKYSEVFGEFFVAVDTLTAMLDFAEPREKRIAELEAQTKKMKDCLNKWYNQHNIDDYTETFYDNLLRDTEKYLWGDSEND